MESTTKITPYEVNDEKHSVGDSEFLVVKSVWNKRDMVRLEVCGKSIVVHQTDLIKAISNATGNERF